jgi:hypothetical protein
MEQAHGVPAAAGVWLGDLEGTYSASRRELIGLWSHLGVGAVRAEYTVWFDGRAFESNLSQDPTPIPGDFNIPPAEIVGMCRCQRGEE